MSTYLTLTIGPVVDTLLSARHTREMWAASYLFSYIIRETIRTACNPDADAQTKAINNGNVLLPTLQKNIEGEYTYGAGLYPDRIYVQVDDPSNDSKRLDWALDEVLQQVAGETAKQLFADADDPNHVQAESVNYVLSYLKKYLRINILQNEIEANRNIVLEITPFLDASEQYARLLSPEPPDLRSPLMLLFDQANGSFLFKDGFGGTRPPGVKKQKRFHSLMEIATEELDRLFGKDYDDIADEALSAKEEEKGEEMFIKKLKQHESIGKEFKAYHKYVTIVHVDGDNVGKVVSKVAKDPEQLKEFSGKLRDFALDATELVYKYGGAPVYAGGDDMLFFAPVACVNDGKKQTIFDLFDQLDGLFQTKLVSYAEGVKAHEDKDKKGNLFLNPKLLPTLSYGVSISYYKYPLFEARNASFGQLEAIKEDREKNGVGVKFLKHSGHAINFTLHKHRAATYAAFLELLRNHLPGESNFLNSFTYKLENQRVLLTAAASNPATLTEFFRNNFNEVWDKFQPFFLGLIPFISALYAESAAGEKEIKSDGNHQNWTQLLYATLRFIHFLKSKDADDE